VPDANGKRVISLNAGYGHITVRFSFKYRKRFADVSSSASSYDFMVRRE
jgi:hypothetical protein